MAASCPRLGFLVRIVLHPDTEPRTVIRLRDAFGEWARAQGLSFRVGGTIRHWAYPIWRDGSQAQHLDREAVREWAHAQREVISVEPGPLVDLDD